MRIQVLGTGCAKCRELTARAKAAADSLGAPYELEKVEDLERIMAFGVMSTPALAVDGAVKCAGRVPAVAEIAGWLKGG